MALLLGAVGLAAGYGWKSVSESQQFPQLVDKINPIVTTQNVALTSVDTRVLGSETRKRNARDQPDFYAKPNYVMTRKGIKGYDGPEDVAPTSNYNRGYVRSRKIKRMNVKGLKKANTLSDAIITTDFMSRKWRPIDTSQWPY